MRELRAGANMALSCAERNGLSGSVGSLSYSAFGNDQQVERRQYSQENAPIRAAASCRREKADISRDAALPTEVEPCASSKSSGRVRL